MELLTHLRNISFFEHLEPHEFEALAAHFHLTRYIEGDDILKQGQQTEHFFIVEAGAVNMRHTDRSGLERPVGSKGPGDYFGIKMFTTQEPSEYTFESISAASLWVLERREWDRVLAESPGFLDHMPELRQEFERLTRGLDWLAPGEVIHLMTRRHWWALVLMCSLPLAVAALFSIAFWVSARLGVAARLNWLLPVYAVVMVACLVWTAWRALNWWNDTFIVTNRRVVSINKIIFFSETRNELAIDKIQSQRIERGGPISVLLNISDLRITSASSDAMGVLFAQVGDVERIQHIISNEQVRVQEVNRAKEREQLRGQIAREIRPYVFQQPAAPEPAKTEYSARAAAVVLPWQRWGPGRKKRVARPRPKTPPVPLRKRLRDIWISMFGTEIREGKIVTWRKDYFILFQQIGIWLLFFLVLVAVIAAITYAGDIRSFVNNGVYTGLGFLTLIAFLGVVWQWLDWRVDLYRLTENEIFDIESLPFGLRYHESKADLNRIQDVTYAREGIINTLLDYGDVITRVAGNAQPFTFIAVTHPRMVADEISERIEILKLRATERTARENTRQVVDAIVAYHRLMMAERFQDSPAPAPTSAAETQSEPQVPPPSLAARAPSTEIEGEFPPEADF